MSAPEVFTHSASGFSMTREELEQARASHAAFMQRQIQRGRELCLAADMARDVVEARAAALSAYRRAKAEAKRARKANSRAALQAIAHDSQPASGGDQCVS